MTVSLRVAGQLDSTFFSTKIMLYWLVMVGRSTYSFLSFPSASCLGK